MKIAIESTNRMVQVETPTGDVPARLWEGFTESGIAVQCLITRIAASSLDTLDQFERELTEHRPPAPGPQAFPLRFLIA
jgi:hypothetical protein